MSYPTKNLRGQTVLAEKYEFVNDAAAFRFFAHASAAGGALIPACLVEKLMGLGEKFRFTPEKILRIIRQCDDEVIAREDCGGMNNGYRFTYDQGGAIQVIYEASPISEAAPITSIVLRMNSSGTHVVIEARDEETIRRRETCGHARVSYAEIRAQLSDLAKTVADTHDREDVFGFLYWAFNEGYRNAPRIEFRPAPRSDFFRIVGAQKSFAGEHYEILSKLFGGDFEVYDSKGLREALSAAYAAGQRTASNSVK